MQEIEAIMAFIWDVITWLGPKWPYWVPILTFFVGIGIGHTMAKAESMEQLKRLSRRIQVPDAWRNDTIDVELDGRPLTRPEMAKAALLIRAGEGHGSGVCISSKGLVVTNAHVVGDAGIVEVEDEGMSYLGVVVRQDLARDVAVLHVGDVAMQSVAIFPEQVEVGDDIFVGGTPYRTENKNLLTKGVISKIAILEGQNYLFIDAAIAPGNSGGPVFDASGRLIGLSVAIQQNTEGELTHIGMVIPIHEAITALQINTSEGDRKHQVGEATAAT